MDIDSILNKFLNLSFSIEITKKFSTFACAKEIECIDGYIKSKAENNSTEYVGLMNQISGVWDASDGQYYPFKYKELDFDDVKRNIIFQINGQYCWLLVEHREAFDLFLKEIFAYIGTIDCSMWSKKDFGDAESGDLSAKSYDWYLGKSMKMRKVLGRLQKLYPSLTDIVQVNPSEIDLVLAICTIKKFRQIIVHNGGFVDDKAKTMDEILNDFGSLKKRKLNKDDVAFVEKFFLFNNDRCYLHLLEKDLPLAFGAYDKFSPQYFDAFMSCLRTYALAICRCVAASANSR